MTSSAQKSSRKETLKHYSFIDGLRALAILPVVFFHFNMAHMTGGYVGVDIFFVLSGFLITGLIDRQLAAGNFSIVHFYERRCRRILPPLFVTCFASVIAAYFLFMPHDFLQFSRVLGGISFFGSNFILARWTGYFAHPDSSKPLLHTWSLAVEEQFYVIFPLLLVALGRIFKNRRAAVRAAVYILCAISFALSVALLHASPAKTFYLLHTRAWELLAGAILALHLKEIKLRRAMAEILSALGLAVVLLCVFLYNRNTPFPGLAALPPVLATVFLLWANIGHETLTKKIFESRPAVGIGLISYGLYLYHWPLLAFTHYYLDSAPPPAAAAALIAAAFALATVSYFYIERPIRAGGVFKRKTVFALSGLGLVTFGLIGLTGLHTKGLPQRFDATVLRYAAVNDYSGHVAVPEKCVATGWPDLQGVSLCKFGKDPAAKPDFLLWGDSHAGAIESAVRRDSGQYGVTGWAVVRSGCPSLIGAARADGFADYSCPDIARAVLRIIRENHIRTVLMVSRWDMYALGWEKGSDETTREPFISFTTAGGRRLLRKQAFSAAFMATVKKLHAMGVTVWVMRQVPAQLVYVSSALARAAYFGRDPARLERTYEAIRKRRHFIGAVFRAAAREYPLHFIDPADTFCPQHKMCLISADGQSLYTDNSHLSFFGAQWSRNMLDPFFKTLR